MPFPVPPIEPMEAKLVAALARGGRLAVRAQMGRLPLPGLRPTAARCRCSPSRASRWSAIFPRWSTRLRACPNAFVLDGELLIPVGTQLSFAALQMRLHPAESRIRTPRRGDARAADAVRSAYGPERKSLVDRPLAERRDGAGGVPCAPPFERPAPVALHARSARSPSSGWRRAAARSTASSPSAATSPIAPGERAMLKVKRLRTADCVVGGFRYASGGEACRLAAARALRR